MANAEDLKTWEELERRLRQLQSSNGLVAGARLGHYSHLLFRGQADASWNLDTTLERASPSFTKLAEYYRLLAIAKTQIETFTAHRWAEIDYQEVMKSWKEYDAFNLQPLPSYDFLVYLRHHGFPSPLLDWSRSFYVAAFFACNAPEGDRVAIYAYREYGGGGKTGSSGSAQIKVLGPFVRSHPRHFMQQGEYTLCCQYSEGGWHFASHSSVFDRGNVNQDTLWKFTLPASEAGKVIRRLDEYNINAFSLFQSEESLMATLAARHFPA